MKGEEKIVNKFLTDPKHITVEDCDKILTLYGYSLHKKGGSHRSYHKYATTPINIASPKRSKYILSPYVNRIIRDLGLEEK